MWFAFGIIGIIIWIAIAFWPARVAGRKGHSFIGYFLLSLLFFPLAADHGLHGEGPNHDDRHRIDPGWTRPGMDPAGKRLVVRVRTPVAACLRGDVAS